MIQVPSKNTLKILGLASFFAVAFIFMATPEAFAAVSKAGFRGTQERIAEQIVSVPIFIAVIAYVIAAFFAATGLVKLKDWISEPEKNPLNAAMFRLIVSSLLIVLPHVLIIINTTLFGLQSNGSTRDSNINVRMQSMTAFERAK